MKAGTLRHHVEIQQLVETTDAFGQPTHSYVHFANSFAEIRPLLGRENFAEKQVRSDQTHKIKMRYLEGVTASMRILYNGRTYEVIGFPVNYNEQNIFLTFNAAEVIDHEQTVPPVETPILCADSVGGADGTEYNLDGTWKNDCTIFKGV